MEPSKGALHPPLPDGNAKKQSKHHPKIFVVMGIIGILGICFFAFSLFQVPPQSNNSFISPPILKGEPPSSASPQDQNQGEKTWKVTLVYNTEKDSLSLGEVTLLNENAASDYRDSASSAYRLAILTVQGKQLYTTKISINKGRMYPHTDKDVTITERSITYKTVLYIPYHVDGRKLLITKKDENILNISLPEQLSFQQNTTASSQSVLAAQSCKPIEVAFMSDGYSDFNQFHKDIENIKEAFKKTEPYASLATPFAFTTIDNKEPLRCGNNIYSCIESQRERILSLGKKQSPHASKFIVLGNYSDPVSAGVADIGGDLTIVTTQHTKFPQTAIHEFLGHLVGRLYDRYVFTGNRGSDTFDYDLKSNCTTDPNGEPFWKDAGVQQAFRGCINNNFYAPSRPTCEGTANLISGGAADTAMGVCGNGQFDAVEKAWIKTQVLPYLGCAAASNLPTTGTRATPTPVKIKCERDPRCQNDNSNLQLCQLVCKPEES